ncbi:MAG: hypothetical protein M3P14_02910 [Chloroflexota bacterium]|nr:hypothetical protein [Chloroflexota bacterium]
MANLPSGTVTFVFTDIEGSTSLLKRLGDDRYGSALATHRRLVRSAFAKHGGEEIDTQGRRLLLLFHASQRGCCRSGGGPARTGQRAMA